LQIPIPNIARLSKPNVKQLQNKVENLSIFIMKKAIKYISDKELLRKIL